MSHSANRSWSLSAGVQVAEGCSARLLQRRQKVKILKHYSGEGAVNYWRVFAVWVALERKYREKRECTSTYMSVLAQGNQIAQTVLQIM